MKYKNLIEVERGFVEDGIVPGVAFGVAKNGEIDYEQAYGFADLENKTKMTTDSLFELWSTTKPIVMTAAMTLFEQGKFLLQDRLSDYLPAYKHMKKYVKTDKGWEIEELKRPILVEHAFNMAMGLPYASAESEIPSAVEMDRVKNKLIEKYGGDNRWDIVEEVNEMANVPVMFEPGEDWMYGYGHELVAALVKVVSGMEVSDYLKKAIFEPLSMESTGYRTNQREKLVSLYIKDENGWKKEPSVFGMHDDSMKLECGGAGLVSTVSDYLKFAAMMANGGTYRGEKIISKKTIDLMRTERLTPRQHRNFDNSYNAGYGYGLGVRTMMRPELTSNVSVGEFGWTGMMGTYVSIDPSENFAFVHMHQMFPNEEERIHHRARNAAYSVL